MKRGENQNDILMRRIYHFKVLERIGEEIKVGMKERKLRLFNSYTLMKLRDSLLHYFTLFKEEETQNGTSNMNHHQQLEKTCY